MTSRWSAAVAAALLAGAPRAAGACAVCLGSQSDLARQAFFGTTMLLTLLPLGLIGGLIWWIRKRARQLESEERRRLAAEAPLANRISSSR